jgi:hypothetical protein
MSREVLEGIEAVGLEERQIPAEIVAAIAAAATALLGSSMRIRSIEPVHRPHERLSRWTQVGRASVQTSHNLKRKR